MSGTLPADGPQHARDADAADVLGRHIRLDRAATTPLWLQMRQGIAATIACACLAPGTRLPSEMELCDLFDVSRPVVRAALDALAAEGVVVKEARRRAFVAHPRDELDFAASNIGLFGDMTAKGHKVTTRMVAFHRRAPIARESALLHLEPGAEVVHLSRVYLVDDEPMAVGYIALPARRIPGFETVDLTNRSMYRTLRERYGIEIVRSERWLDAVPLGREHARLLQLREGTPVINIESIGWLADGTPMEYYNSVYSTRGRRIHLVVSSTGQGR